MKLFEKIRELFSKTSNARFISYMRYRGISVGDNVNIMDPMSAKIDFGRSKWITIGSNTVFAPGLTIMAHDYSWKNLMIAYGKVFPSGGKPIVIGNNVFVGVNSTILGGGNYR